MSIGRRSIGLVAAIAALATAAIVAAPVQAQSAPSGQIRVAAAASLTDVLPVIGRAFERRHPGTKVAFSFGGSSTIASQVVGGAPVDVLATASEATMRQATSAGAVEPPQRFARNAMTVVVPSDNPGGVRTLADLARPGVLVGVCDVSVPCGAAAAEVIRKARLAVRPVTRELDVRALLGKVRAGELDAGIVYVTDARAAGSSVRQIALPRTVNASTTYPVAVVRESGNPVTARAFADFLRRDPAAQSALRAAGFTAP